MRTFRAVIVGILSVTLGATVWADPFMKGKDEQIKLGLQVATELRKKEKVLPETDPRVQLLRRLATKLLATYDSKETWKWSFDVIESKQVNAFALPGGPTFFYTGLIDKLKTEDELIGVLGHEMTHVRREHWARANAAQTKRELLLGALLIGTRANDTVSSFAGLYDNVTTLQFSRGDESQADKGGFDAMVKAGFNPEGMAQVFRMLAAEQKGGAPPEFLSDHPSDKHRIDRIEKMIKDLKIVFPAQIPLPEWPKPLKKPGKD